MVSLFWPLIDLDKCKYISKQTSRGYYFFEWLATCVRRLPHIDFWAIGEKNYEAIVFTCIYGLSKCWKRESTSFTLCCYDCKSVVNVLQLWLCFELPEFYRGQRPLWLLVKLQLHSPLSFRIECICWNWPCLFVFCLQIGI